VEKLIEQFNKECDVTSRSANQIWSIGQIILSSIFLYLVIEFGKFSITIFIFFAICMFFLYFFCEYINLNKVKDRLKLKKIIIVKSKYTKTTYEELDKFQKDWITNYCKRNNLNKISKLEIIRKEINNKREGKIKYINPIIIGTLLIAVWETLVEERAKEIGSIIPTILPLIILSIFISVIIGEIMNQFKFNNLFKSYTGYERLEQLLLFVILKCNK